MKRQLLTMQILRWMLLALTLALVSAQRIGPNYGITIRLTHKGLNFAGTAAATALFRPSTRLPNIAGRVGSVRYGASSIRFSGVTPPRVEVFPGFAGRNPSAKMTIDEITIDGNIWASRIFVHRSGSFQIRASRISVETFVSLGNNSRGKPEVEFDSCSRNSFSVAFTRRPTSVIGRMVSETIIRQRLETHLRVQLCSRVRGLIRQLNDKLAELQTVTRLTQDNRITLDYSLIRNPSPHLFFIDTVLKGDPTWRGRRTGISTITRTEQFNFQHFNKMAIFYITDYVLNALGLLLHNDRQIQADITRDKISSSVIRQRLALSCTSSNCAGGIFPDLRTRYPDGWLEADLRSTSAPRAVIGNDLVTGNFQGRFVLYVKRPSGSRIQVASGQANLRVPLVLSIRGNLIRAFIPNPRITITRATLPIPQVARALALFQRGFIHRSMAQLSLAGFPLPSYRGITFISPRIEIGNRVIRLVTDLRYTPTSTG